MFCPISTLPVKTVTWPSSPMCSQESSVFGISSPRRRRAPDSCARAWGAAMPTTMPPPSSLKKSRRSRSKSCRRREMPSCWASSELAGGRMLAFPFQLGGPLDRFNDTWIGAAAADVAVHALNDLFSSGIRRVIEKRRGGENHPRRAVAALEGFDFKERLLHGIELAPAP